MERNAFLTVGSIGQRTRQNWQISQLISFNQRERKRNREVIMTEYDDNSKHSINYCDKRFDCSEKGKKAEIIKHCRVL